MSIFLNDLVCGSCAGLSYILTAHPLDSIKVRMQLERRPNISLRSIIKETYAHEGFRGFYKGMGSPLITIPAVNSIVFASYELAKRMMGVRVGEECTFQQSIIAGSFGGFMNSFILSPIELVKCRLQVQRENKSTAYYKGPYDCLRKIIVEEGISNGLFRGLASTLARETPCYAGQFAAYYSTKQALVKFNKLDSTDDLGLGS